MADADQRTATLLAFHSHLETLKAQLSELQCATERARRHQIDDLGRRAQLFSCFQDAFDPALVLLNGELRSVIPESAVESTAKAWCVNTAKTLNRAALWFRRLGFIHLNQRVFPHVWEAVRRNSFDGIPQFDTPPDAQQRTQTLLDAFYDLDADVIRFLEALRGQAADEDNDNAEAKAEDVHRQPNDSARPSMRRLSNGWRFDWLDDTGEEAGEVDDLKGFVYIAQLIGTPHVSIPAVRLLGIKRDDLVVLSEQHSVQPTWDSTTVRDVAKTEAELEAKLLRLNKECQDAQEEGDDAAYRDSDAVRGTTKDELVELRRAKADAIKPNGQSRELNKPYARQQEGVRGAIRRAVEHLDKKKLKRLALHFADFAKPDGSGMAFVYCPDPAVTWNVEATTPTG